ncbi:MAG: efflux RND transporter periplasmic adaptor subunit [Muribaculaceae bacterium]|nr:efflux RND transporter periplasmic adaptor subunit [Muribaculaceae bacterium]
MKTKIFSTILSLTLIGCGSHSHEDAADVHNEAEEHHHHDEDEIIVKPEDAKRFGIGVEVVAATPFNEVVKVIGEVLPVASDQAIVSAPTSGIVRLAGGITQGSGVTAGQRIASISAKGVTGGDPNEAAKVTLDAAKRELDRITPLYDDGIVTKKDYNDALQAYESAKTAYSRPAAGGGASSPINGIVSNMMVADGEYVEAGQPIATIARSTRLTLKALLPQKYISFLPLIETANIIPAQSESVISLKENGGKLLSSSVSGGNDIQGYIPVYFTFDNNGAVAPGSAADVYLIGNMRGATLTVPVSALTEQMGESFVYVKEDDHGYDKRNVKVGRNDGKRVEILSGIAEGDSVVTQGVTFVRLAETSTVVPEGHSHSH